MAASTRVGCLLPGERNSIAPRPPAVAPEPLFAARPLIRPARPRCVAMPGIRVQAGDDRHRLRANGSIYMKLDTESPIVHPDAWHDTGRVMTWHDWGSPVGLAILLVGIGVCALLVRVALVGH